MGFYLDEKNNYYEGDRINLSHIEVPRRPDSNYDWSGSEWIFNLDIYKEVKINQLDIIFSEWFKFKRTLSPQNIRDVYWNGVDNINAGTNISEVDIAYNDIIAGLF